MKLHAHERKKKNEKKKKEGEEAEASPRRKYSPFARALQPPTSPSPLSRVQPVSLPFHVRKLSSFEPTLIYLETVTNTIPIRLILLRIIRACMYTWCVCVCEATRDGERKDTRERERDRDSSPLKGLVLISSVDNTHSLIPL